MKKFMKAVDFCLPVIFYIAFSLLAFLLWNVFNYGEIPIICTSIILCIAGSLLSGFFSRGTAGKKGMYAAIGVAAAGVVLWVIAYTFNISPVAYVATVLSSYYFNIESCLPFTTPNYAIYIGYIIALVVPIGLILIGRMIRVKVLKGKA